MQFKAALIKEQGVTFAIVIVKSYVLDNDKVREDTRYGFASVFPAVPIILMAQNSRGIPVYHGRPDIVNFLANINPSRIPWRRYNYT